jgi:hypothetical protein
MFVEYYRYLSDPSEVAQVIHERRIQSMNLVAGRATWYSAIRYDNPIDAQRTLALPHVPSHRVGPVAELQMPPLDIKPRPLAPAFGYPGGGVEVRTVFPVHIFGLLDFQKRHWDL